MNKNKKAATRQNRRICLPFPQETYNETVSDALRFRLCIDEMISQFPELSPPEAGDGWRKRDSYISKKQGVIIRRMEIAGIARTVRPSFVMPYMAGMTDDAEKVLLLRKFSVPFRAPAYVFGGDPVHWQRTGQSVGSTPIWPKPR